jgi:sugar lactone lactonase YvrE
MSRPGILLACFLLTSCLRAANEGTTAALQAAIKRAPDDLALVYLDASDRAARGDREGALAALERLDQLGYDYPPDARDFPGLANEPRFQTVWANIDRREPRVTRARIYAVIRQPRLIPDGIAVDPRDGTIYVGSMEKHKIVCVKNGVESDFAKLDGVQVLGLNLDVTRGTLWALGKFDDYGSVWAFDLTNGHQRLHIEGPGSGEHLFNDITVANDGTAYVTDSTAGAVWQLKPGSHGLEAFLPPGSMVFPNAIMEDGTHLLVATELGIVNVAPDHTMQPLAAPPKVTLAGIDGLDRDGDVLLAVQNGIGAPRIMRFELNHEHTAIATATILETRNPAFQQPTTGVIYAAQRVALVVADGFINRLHPQSIAGATPPVSTMILAIPLDPPLSQ